ncbi:MAG: hypothetical protein KDC34_14965 [Saprospiraceae bacterium]|nr:hypothetical protein [Saprospiraceae bacterium]
MQLLVAFLLISLISNKIDAQPDKPNVLSLEFFGKSAYYFDLNYSRKLTDHFQVGAGVGFHQSRIIRDSEGDYRIFDLSLPIFGTLVVGEGHHHMISEFGTTLGLHFGGFSPRNGFSGLTPFFSVGYEYEGEKFLFRFPLYLAFIGESEFLRPVMPWLGISVGLQYW